MTKYNLVTQWDSSVRIEHISDDGIVSFVPVDESNADYQAYLKSLEPVEEPVAPEEDTAVADSPAKA